MRIRLIGLVLPVILAGCHSVTLMGPDGRMGTGSVSGLSGSGSVEVTLNGTHYSGHWVNAISGSFGSSFGHFGGTAFGSSGFAAGNGTGNAFLHSDDGKHNLRCYFSMGGFSSTGIGKCQDEAGVIYDLQIS